MNLSQITDRINDGKMTLEHSSFNFGVDNCVQVLVGLANGSVNSMSFPFNEVPMSFYELIFETSMKRGGTTV